MKKIVLNPLVTKLFEELKKRKVSVPKFATISGIDKDRIYKWKQQGTNPKHDDVVLINNWLSGKKMDINTKIYPTNEELSIAQEEEAEYTSPKLVMKTLADLAASNKEMAEANKILAVAQAELVTMLKEKNTGKS
jgi:hypothetical protein